MGSVKTTLPRIAPWVAFSVAGAWGFGVWGFIAGAVLVALAEALTFLRESQAMKHAAAQGLALISSDAKAIHARLEEVEKQLKIALTPERIELSKKLVESKMAGLLKF